MRVLSILPFSPPARSVGGAERQMHALHLGLKASGVEVDVLADIEQVGQTHQVYEGVDIWGVRFPVLTSHPLRPGTAKLWRDWLELRRFVQRRLPRPDLIHVTTFRQSAMVGYGLARALGVPWLVRLACSGSNGDFRYIESNWLGRWLAPRMLDHVDMVVALDQETRREALDRGAGPHRIAIIRNGLALKRPPKVRSPETEGAKIFNVLFLGRLAAQKRLPTLVDAWSALVGAGMPHRLTLAGAGEVRGALEAQVADRGTAAAVVFLGQCDDPQATLEQADLFVNPSESEGLPNAVLEAAACGLPLILSDIPIHREIAQAVGMADYLFPVGDAGSLASQLQRFMALSAGERTRLARQCAAYGAGFSAAARDEAYLDLYRRLLERDAPRQP